MDAARGSRRTRVVAILGFGVAALLVVGGTLLPMTAADAHGNRGSHGHASKPHHCKPHKHKHPKHEHCTCEPKPTRAEGSKTKCANLRELKSSSIS